MPEVFWTSSPAADWRPSPIVALATSHDGSKFAAARDDGSLEIWLVSPGSVGWHCQLTMHGDPNSKVSSLVWSRSGRLFSSSIDGSVSEWDLYHLKQKTVLETIGVTIWQMALAPSCNLQTNQVHKAGEVENGHADEDLDNGVGDVTSESESESESEDDSDAVELHQQTVNERIAFACDDGCVRIYTITESRELIYSRSLPRVSGRVLCVTWSPDASLIYSGTSDGFIRCWDTKTYRETYRITVGGRSSVLNLCVWSLLALRCGTLVSGDSSGSVQFWDSQHGTPLQDCISYHKGDVRALAAAPSHKRVFSAGSDGQVILYMLSVGGSKEKFSLVPKKWENVGYVRAHTHDIRCLTIAEPISREDHLPDESIKRKSRKERRKEKSADFSYRKWAHEGVPMLISAGEDSKLFAYTVQEFTKFAPHDICPTPQRSPIQLVLNSVINGSSLLLVQSPYWLDIFSVQTENCAFRGSHSGPSGGQAPADLLVRVKSKGSRRILCSAMSSSGARFAYSDDVKPSLFELTKAKIGKSACIMKKKKLPQRLPSAHSILFSSDSSQLILAGHDRKIYVVDVETSELVQTFKPCRNESAGKSAPDEPPITKMFTSSDGQWLAAVNCLGDIYVYNLEIQRSHWFISRLGGASVTACGFHPSRNNIFVVTTSSNHVYVFDVEAKQLGEWSTRYMSYLPKRFQEFPGEVIGLSFPPSTSSTCVVIYSSRSMCVIDFALPVERDEEYELKDEKDLVSIKLQISHANMKRKRSITACETINKNFGIIPFRDPVLFVGHLSKGSVLIVDKPWMEVLQKMDTAPVHRHIFGT